MDDNQCGACGSENCGNCGGCTGTRNAPGSCERSTECAEWRARREAQDEARQAENEARWSR